MKPGKTGFRRLFDATGYSWKGLKATFTNEAAFRQELALTVIMFPASFWLARDVVQWLMLIAPLFLLLIVELLNSAVESAIDRIGEEKHDLSGRAKDMGSAAVLLSLILLALSWSAIAWSNYHA